MQLNDTHMFDKGDLAYVALNAIEEFVRNKGYKLGLGSDDGIHEALWEALGLRRGRPCLKFITLQKPLLTNQ